MAITTIYKCDKCGREQNSGEQMWHVDVRINHYGHTIQSSPHKDLTKLWCRTCVEDVGLLPYASRPKPAEPIQVTSLEDMIRMIVQDELVCAREVE